MADNITTVETLKNSVKKFTEDREWQQFHSPKNLSMAMASEVAEVMDLFLWCDNHVLDFRTPRRQDGKGSVCALRDAGI